MPFQWPYTKKEKIKLAMPSSFKSVPEAKTILDTVFKDIEKISRYELYNRLVFADDDLRGAIDRMAQMVRYSYKGIVVHAGYQLDDREKSLLRECRNFERLMNIKQLFFSISQRMIQDGDLVCLKWSTDQGKINGLLPLPMTDLTAVESEDQFEKIDSSLVIQNPKFYILNERVPDKRKPYEVEDCVIFSMNNFALKIQDNIGRWTYGVWSLSPLESIKAKMLWKLSTMVNDMIWKRRNVPKVHWQIDLGAFEPDQFPGDTFAAKQQAAQAAAETEVKKFSEMLRVAEVDEGIITDLETKAKYLEPSTVRYISPNDLSRDLTEGIFRSIGVPEAALRGSYASQVMAASYSIVAAEMIADIIKTQMLNLTETYLRTKNFTDDDLYTDEGLRKVDIKTQLILPAFREESMRIAAVMSATESFTYDEVREEVGKEPLTDEQIERLIDIEKRRGREIAGRTKGDIISSFIQRRDRENQPDTPQSQRERQVT